MGWTSYPREGPTGLGYGRSQRGRPVGDGDRDEERDWTIPTGNDDGKRMELGLVHTADKALVVSTVWPAALVTSSA